MTIEESKHQISGGFVIHLAHFAILDEEACIWFAWVNPHGEESNVFPVIVSGNSFIRLTGTAVYNLIAEG